VYKINLIQPSAETEELSREHPMCAAGRPLEHIEAMRTMRGSDIEPAGSRRETAADTVAVLRRTTIEGPLQCSMLSVAMILVPQGTDSYD
jgi:hypothetical protein